MAKNKLIDRKKQLAEKREREEKLETLKEKGEELAKELIDKEKKLKSLGRNLKKIKLAILKKVKRFYSPLLKNLSKKIIKYLKKIKRWIKKILEEAFGLRYLLCLGFSLYFLITNFNSLYYRFGVDDFENKKKVLNFYPNSIINNLEFSKVLFEKSYQDMANKFLFLAKERLSKGLSPLPNQYWNNKIKETEKYLKIPERKKELILDIENNSNPYSWQLVLKRAELESELYLKDKYNQSIDLVYWLNPGLDISYKERLGQ